MSLRWSLRRRIAFFPIAAVLLAGLFLASCGGGSGGGGGQPPPPPKADFSLFVEQQTVTVQQQGAYQYQTIEVKPENGFDAAITVTISSLPAGVTMTPSGPFSFPASRNNQSVSPQLSASLAAAAGTTQITLTATSGSIVHTATFSLAVTAAAPFAIQASPASISIGPATNLAVQVSVTANMGTSPSLSVSLSEVPPNAGFTTFPPQSLLTPTNPVQFLVEAGVLAQPEQGYPIVVTATDGSGNSSQIIVPLTISVPPPVTTPTRSSFVRTDQSPSGMVYDRARELLFVNVEVLNEVVVLSSVDGHRVASIPVQYPGGIDEAVDGSAVYVVSGYFPYITTIDPNLLQVVQQTSLPTGVSCSFQFAALSNGDVLLPCMSSAIELLLWNPVSNTFSLTGQGLYFGTLPIVIRTEDHSKVLLVGSLDVFLYSAAGSSFSGPLDFGGNLPWAMSPDASQFIAGSNVGSHGSYTAIGFYDSNGDLLGSVALDFQPMAGTIYSLDGSRVYVMGTDLLSMDNVAAVIDAKTFSLLGVVPGFPFGAALPFSGYVNSQFAIDETNMIFGPVWPGPAFLDVSAPSFLTLPLSTGGSMSPAVASLSSSTQAQLQGAYFSSELTYGAFFGPPPASPQTLVGTNLQVETSNSMSLTVPAGTAAGPANMTLTRSDGSFQVIPDAVSFEPTVLQVDANAGSPSGGDVIKVVGYGFNGSNTNVTIGGKPATNLGVQAPQGNFLPTEYLTFKTPAGTAGYADVVVSSGNSATTIAGGFQYVNSLHVYPITGALDAIAYDQARQRLYATNQDHNRVEIFDLGSNAFLTPISVGSQPTALALTPDGAKLGVINSGDVTVSVIDPTAGAVLATYPIPPGPDSYCNVPLNMTPVTPHRMLINLACTDTLNGGVFHLGNLDTGSFTCTGVAGCQSDGIDMSFGNCCALGAGASVPDGSKVFLAPEGSGGSVTLLDLTANSFRNGYLGIFNDVAADADGNIFASSFGTADLQLARLSIMAYERYADVGNQSLHNVIGEKLNPSGSLLFVPQDSGVTVFDVHSGRLVLHVAVADGIPLDTNAMALDETGSKMFLISNSGITIAQLFQAPLSLATTNPSSGSSGTVVKLRGSGFQSTTTVSFGTSQAAATYVDPNTMMATVPSLSPGPVRITVTNADSHAYAFDDAFTVQ